MIDRQAARRLLDDYADQWPSGSFLAELGSQDVGHLLACGEERRCGAGVELIHEDSPDRSVFLLIDAVVKAVTYGRTRCREGGGRVLHAIRSSGDIVGEVAFIDGGHRSATVVTARRDCLVVRVPEKRLTSLIEDNPRIGRQISMSATAKMRASVERGSHLLTPTPVRLARALLELTGRHGHMSGDAWVLDVGMTQDELGSYIGVTRTAVTTELTKLRNAGIISTGRGMIVILQPALLREHADPVSCAPKSAQRGHTGSHHS